MSQSSQIATSVNAKRNSRGKVSTKKAVILSVPKRICDKSAPQLPPYVVIRFSDGSLLKQSNRALIERGICPHCLIDKLVDMGLVGYAKRDCIYHDAPFEMFSEHGIEVGTFMCCYGIGTRALPYLNRGSRA